MSSGEKNKKEATSALQVRLTTVVEGEPEKLAAYPNSPEMDAALEYLGIESPPPEPLKVEWVKDENYHAVSAAFEHLLELVEEGAETVTKHDIRRLLDEVKPKEPPPTRPWQEAFEEFLSTRRISESSMRRYRCAKKVYVRHFGDKRLGEIMNRDILMVIQDLHEQGRAATTQQFYRTAPKTFFSYCVQNDYIAKNPVNSIPVPDGEEREGVPLEVEDCRTLLQVARTPQVWEVTDSTGKREPWEQTWNPPPWLFPALLISLHTGLRQGNVNGKEKGIRWGDVDLKRGRITIDGGRMKNKRKLELPIHPELQEFLWAVPPGPADQLVVPNAPRDPRSAWKTVCKHAKIIDHRWHDLRTTFSTRLTDADVPESVNAALMGHSSKRNANRRYARATWEKKVDAIRRLPWLLQDAETEDGDGADGNQESGE